MKEWYNCKPFSFILSQSTSSFLCNHMTAGWTHLNKHYVIIWTAVQTHNIIPFTKYMYMKMHSMKILLHTFNSIVLHIPAFNPSIMEKNELKWIIKAKCNKIFLDCFKYIYNKHMYREKLKHMITIIKCLKCVLYKVIMPLHVPAHSFIHSCTVVRILWFNFTHDFNQALCISKSYVCIYNGAGWMLTSLAAYLKHFYLDSDQWYFNVKCTNCYAFRHIQPCNSWFLFVSSWPLSWGTTKKVE